jgi:uncharacterized protein YndB with AHSA1/START domain
VSATHIRRRIDAPREVVYRALLDPRAIPQWRVPDGMSCVVHEFYAREGGAFRVSLTYDSADAAGKTASNTDTYHGRFVKLVLNEEVVERLEFETDDAALRGEMTITTRLVEVDGGTEVVAVHDGLPAGLSPADNETGWRMALGRLAEYCERRSS